MHSELEELYDIQAALNTTTIVAITDTVGKIVFANKKFCEISQYSTEELIGNTHRIINSGYHSPAFFKKLWQTISQGEIWRGEICNKAKDGSIYWVDTYIIPFIEDNGKPYQYVSIRHDITEKKILEAQLQKQLIEDQITGLPNAVYLKNEVEQRITNNEKFYLLTINVDDFKSFNESLGNFQADLVLKYIGERLSSIANNPNTVLARTYSDEFALLCDTSEPNIEALIQKIIGLFEHPICYLGIDYYITFCIGAVRHPEHAATYEDLFQNADTAVQIAKMNGKNTYVLFDESMTKDTNRKLRLKNMLYEAIQHKKFVMFYQPQFNAQNEIMSFEALVRWYDQEEGFISPAEFIPAAERTGLIIPLGYLLFELVLQDLPQLQKAVGKAVKIAFNLSLKQFFDKNLISHLIQLFETYHIDPRYIKIEITEGVAASKIDYVIAIIKKLRDLGMEVELDDYGTGFSSLKYLKDFQINCIKIDQSFVKDLFEHSSSKAIINSTIQMAHELGFTILAEGIEIKEQLQYLKDKGCDGFQGYLLGKPQPVSYYQEGKWREVIH